MPGVPLSDDLKDKIVKWYYEDQETMKEIAVQARCSIGTVSNVLRLYREYGKFKDPFRQRTGRPPKLSEADLKFLDAIVVANPSLYLDEIQQKLKDVREVEVSIATLARALASLELTRKQITKAAYERDEELRTLWEAMMAEYNDPEVFVALDESAVDGRTGQRGYGRSRVGNPCVKRMTFLRGVRYSILPALTTDGMIALDVFEGSITKEKFLYFLREQVVCGNFYATLSTEYILR